MTCKRWDIVLVSFPFTDFRNEKKRPALVISPDLYNKGKDVIIAFITSNIKIDFKESDVVIREWNKSGLPKPSIIRMKLATIDKSIIIKIIGKLQKNDINKFINDFFDFIADRN